MKGEEEEENSSKIKKEGGHEGGDRVPLFVTTQTRPFSVSFSRTLLLLDRLALLLVDALFVNIIGGGSLVLLVFGDEVLQVGLGFGELHLVLEEWHFVSVSLSQKKKRGHMEGKKNRWNLPCPRQCTSGGKPFA